MIPFLDLKAQYHSIKPEIDAAVLGVLESSQFVLGQEVEGFENDFAAYCQARHAIGVNSRTSALHLALLAPYICNLRTPISATVSAAFQKQRQLLKEVFSLPLFPELTLEEQDVVSSAVVSASCRA